MGSGPSVEVYADQESPSDPGKRSVVSAPLTEYCDDYNAFYDGVLHTIKDPIANPLENFFIKEVQITEIGPEEVIIKIIHDGTKLQKAGVQKGCEDRVREWSHLWSSREQREIVQEFYSPDGEKITATSHVKFLSDPLRVEAWMDLDTGERRSGEMIRCVIRDVYLNSIIREVSSKKVKCVHSTESPSTGGLCAITGPLGEHLRGDVGFGQVFDTALDVLKNTGSSFLAQASGIIDRSVVDVSDTEFQLTFSGRVPRPPGDADADQGGGTVEIGIRNNCIFNRPAGEISGVFSTLEGQLLSEYRFKLHKDPLRLEYYAFIGGRRVSGRPEGAILQTLVDSVTDLLGDDGEDKWFF